MKNFWKNVSLEAGAGDFAPCGLSFGTPDVPKSIIYLIITVGRGRFDRAFEVIHKLFH